MARSELAPAAFEPVQPGNGRRVIDLVHLARQTLGDKGLEQEVLRMFDQSSRAYLKGVQQAASTDECKLNLHALKGASAGIGANGIATAARAAEVEVRDTGKLAPETVADLAFAVEEVSAYIGELLQA